MKDPAGREHCVSDRVADGHGGNVVEKVAVAQSLHITCVV